MSDRDYEMEVPQSLQYQKAYSTLKPDLIDDYSSKYTVYLRKNIVETEYHDEFTDSTVTMYEYDEAKLTKEQYRQYLQELSLKDIEQQRADIDYIALMTGIDLEEV